MATTKQILGWSALAVAGIAVIFGLMPDGWLRKLWAKITAPSSPVRYSSSRTTDTPAIPEENRCVLRNNRGEEITISATQNNELFQRYCREGSAQPILLYNYFYYPVRWWRGGNWHHNGGNGNGNGNGNGAPAM